MKAKNLLVAASVILLAALSAMSLLAERQGYGNLLLVAPASFGAQGLSPEKLEEFSGDEFLLTYEIRQISIAQAINSKHTVTLVGTNHNYADIMGYLTLDGGFFTKYAWDARNKNAVLNETASFQLFGSNRISGQTMKLNGETWIISGVIQDNDTENANVYAPSSVTGGLAESVMALADGEAVTEAYVKNALKGLGIHESGYKFINLSKAASAFDERFSVAWKSALLASILILIFQSVGKLSGSFGFYRSRLKEIYFRELFAYHGADLIKTVTELLFFAAGISAALLLSLEILETCLAWQELTALTLEPAAGAFGGKLAWLRDYQRVDSALFAAYIVMVLLGFFLAVKRKALKTIGQIKMWKAEKI